MGQLWQGHTGQPPWLAVEGQVDDSQNFRHDLSLGGAAKREGMQFVTDLFTDEPPTVPLDPSKKFLFVNVRGNIIAIGNQEIFGWDTDGNLLAVQVITNGAAGTGYVPGDNTTSPTREFGDVPAVSFAYLGVATEAQVLTDLRVAVNQDTVIITNRGTPVRILEGDSKEDGPWDRLECYRYIIQDETATLSTDVGPVETFDDLPEAPAEGDFAYVKIGQNLDPSGHYVFSTQSYPDDMPIPEHIFPRHGDWYRVTEATLFRSDQDKWRINPITMPHRITVDEVNSRLIFDVLPLRRRTSGNTGSNLDPSFVDRTIRSVEFKWGRLFMFTDSQHIASRNRDFFQFYLDVVDQINDQDRIDVDVTYSGIGECLGTRVSTDAIFSMHEKGQLQFKPPSDSVLNNVNGKITTITTFDAKNIAPSGDHNFIAMIDQFDDVHLYAWINGDIGIQYLAKLTIHFPEVLYDFTPERMNFVDTTIYILTAEGQTIVHDIGIIDGQLIQSAWGRYESFEDPVAYLAWGGEVYVITVDAITGYSMLTYRHRDQKPAAGLLWQPYLDRRELIPVGSITYDVNTDITTVPHTGRSGVIGTSFLFITDGDQIHTFRKSVSLDGSGNPQFDGKFDTADQFLGFRYTTQMDLIKLIPMSLDTVQVKELGIAIHKTSDIELQVFENPSVRDPKTNEPSFKKAFQPHRYGVTKYGVPAKSSEVVKLEARGFAPDLLLRIFSESLGPLIVTGIEYSVVKVGPGAK